MSEVREAGLEILPDPKPAMAASGMPRSRKRAVFAGLTASQLVIGFALLAALVWAMWVTHSLTGENPQRIVKADLSRIVGDYVQAQARSATPPDQVEAQMRQFMASLDAELQRRGADGQVVLVGEAVLSKSVTDITPDVMKAVFASGVKIPQPAMPGQMGQMLGAAPAAAPQVPMPAPVAPPTAMASVSPEGQTMFGPMPQAPVAAATNPAMPGASVSTFGGPDVPGNQ